MNLPVYSIKFEVYHHFFGLWFIAEVNFWRPPIIVVSCDFIRECVRLYSIGLARAVPPTNTNFRFRGDLSIFCLLKIFFCFIVFLYMSAGCVSTIRT